MPKAGAPCSTVEICVIVGVKPVWDYFWLIASAPGRGSVLNDCGMLAHGSKHRCWMTVCRPRVLHDGSPCETKAMGERSAQSAVIGRPFAVTLSPSTELPAQL